MTNIFFKKQGILLLALSAIIASCEKDTLPTNFAPEVTTGGTDGIYRTGVYSISGSVDISKGSTVHEYGIQYSLYQSFAEAISVKAATMDSNGNFSIGLNNLEPGESYFYRTYVSSGYNIVYGEARNFTTTTTVKPEFREVTTVSNVSFTSADVESEMLDDGGSKILSSLFIYKIVADENDNNLHFGQIGIDQVPVEGEIFKASLTGLYTNSLYAVRPCAISADGVGEGAIAYFRTEATESTIFSTIMLSDSSTSSIGVEVHILAAGTHPIVETGFCYTSENKQPTTSNLTVQATLEGTTFKTTLTSLNAATTYYIRAYVKDNQGTTSYSETMEYTVAAHQDLDIVTNNADEISPINARLWGNIRDNNVPVRERGFCWSTTEFQVENKTETANVNYVAANTDDERYFVSLDVNFNTTYYFCAYGKNSAGVIYYGDVLSFTTPDINLPELQIGEAMDITEASATISGTVTLDYEYRADYRLKCGFLVSKSHTEPTLETNEINEDLSVTLGAHLTDDDVVIPLKASFNLEPDTQYYYRIYAENEKGLVYSEVKTFTTLKRTPTPDDAEFPELN